MRDFAFNELGWTRAVSYIDPENAASARLAERLDCYLDSDALTPDDDPTLKYVHSR